MTAVLHLRFNFLKLLQLSIIQHALTTIHYPLILIITRLNFKQKYRKYFFIDNADAACKIILKKFLIMCGNIGGELKEFKILYRNLIENVCDFFVRRLQK